MGGADEDLPSTARIHRRTRRRSGLAARGARAAAQGNSPNWSPAVGERKRSDCQNLGRSVPGGARQAGWIDNDNLRIKLRFAGDASGIRASAEELVKLAPD